MRTPLYIYEILQKVYNELYLSISEKAVHCFLCGAGKPKPGQLETLRNKLKRFLDQTPELKVLYAEHFFKNLVDHKNDNNFLHLENILAENADLVIIVLESAGAFVELGAFSNTDNLKNKLIVLMDKYFKQDDSFINLGPIKLLQKSRKKSIIYYENDDITIDTVSFLKKSIDEYLAENDINHSNDLTSIITLYYFLHIYLYFFSPVTFTEILDHIKYISNNPTPDLNIRIRSVLHQLYIDDIAKKEKKDYYVLTNNGFDKFRELVVKNKFKFNDRHLIDKLRLAVLNRKLRLQYNDYKEYYC